MRIHCCPGVDEVAAAKDFLDTGMVGVDDIAENLYDVIFEAIIDELGHAADFMDLREQRVDTSYGPVFVLRDHDRCSAQRARAAVLRERSTT